MKFIFTFLMLGSSLAFAQWGPSPKEAIALLIRSANLKLPLKDQTGCSASMGSTVGEYLSFLLGTLATADRNDTSRVEAKCSVYDAKTSGFAPPDKGKFPTECEFYAYRSDKAGESPWHYGVRFRLTDDGKKIQPDFLNCPGTP